MATCIACEAEIDTANLEVGETIQCVDCGAEMEVISLRPLELELVDEDEEEDDVSDDEEDDDLPDEEETLGG